MAQLSESILDLLKNAASLAGETQNERFAMATLGALDVSIRDGVIGANDLRVYESIMQGMVQSGALKILGKGVFSSQFLFQD